MNSCFSLTREKNTDEVIPAKHVTDAALTLQREGERQSRSVKVIDPIFWGRGTRFHYPKIKQ